MYDTKTSNIDIDFIDVRGLLELVSPQDKAINIKDFISSKKEGADTVLYVDMDGKGTAHDSSKLLTLKNVDTNIDDLLKKHQILY